MTYRSKTISKLLEEKPARQSYVRAKLNQLIPSQIRALRLREDWTQRRLGIEAGMKQARISAMERPGGAQFSLETLVRLASAFNLGLWVEFVPYSEMLKRESRYSQDHFKPIRLSDDKVFLEPTDTQASHHYMLSVGQSMHVPGASISTPPIQNFLVSWQHSSQAKEIGEYLQVPPAPVKLEGLKKAG